MTTPFIPPPLSSFDRPDDGFFASHALVRLPGAELFVALQSDRGPELVEVGRVLRVRVVDPDRPQPHLHITGRLIELRPEIDPIDYAPGDRFAFDLEILATSITLPTAPTCEQLREFFAQDLPGPCIPREDIETLYSLGHYDGPGSGLVRWKGDIYLADCFDMFAHQGRAFYLFKLPQERIEALLTWCRGYMANRSIEHGGIAYDPDGKRLQILPQVNRAAADAWRAANPCPDREPPDGAPTLGYFVHWRRP